MHVGTSGYNYPEWRGSFYPEKFRTNKMLEYYAERFNTVEINYTFYRMPTAVLLEGWAAERPTTSRSRSRPRGASPTIEAAATATICCRPSAETARDARAELGVLLFQLPPTFKT